MSCFNLICKSNSCLSLLDSNLLHFNPLSATKIQPADVFTQLKESRFNQLGFCGEMLCCRKCGMLKLPPQMIATEIKREIKEIKNRPHKNSRGRKGLIHKIPLKFLIWQSWCITTSSIDNLTSIGIVSYFVFFVRGLFSTSFYYGIINSLDSQQPVK